MRTLGRPDATGARAGFTLAEVMVALMLVGGVLVYTLAGLNLSQLESGHTYSMKIARELALQKLGEIESGLYWEDMDDEISGSFSEQGHPDFHYEVVFGSDNFEDERDGAFDSWSSEDDDDDEDEEEAEQPYQEVRIKVTFPPLGEFSNELVVERWLPWNQLYPGEGDDADSEGEEEDQG